VADYEAQGYRVGAFRKEKDALMRFLATLFGLGLTEYETR